MKLFLAAVVFVVLATTGSYALNCYICEAANVETCSTGSATCTGPGEARCGRAVGYTSDGKLYGVVEVCAAKSLCDKPEEACALAKKTYPEVATCKVSCCSEDNCIATGDSSKTSQVMFGILVFGVVTAMLLN